MPNVPEADEVSPVVPDDEAVEAIRATYRKHEYASRQHATFDLIAEIGLRLGAVRAIDLDDFDRERNVIHLHHRPGAGAGSGTPLKNGSAGERIVNLSSGLSELLDDYITYAHHGVGDRGGRKAFFTTSQGRVSTATLRRDFYKLSRPCTYSNECPHERDQSTCKAARNASASECPSSFSTHPLRRWSIMNQLDEGVPKELLSDRVDVSVPVLEKHYDQRTEEQKSRQRREVLESRLGEYGND